MDIYKHHRLLRTPIGEQLLYISPNSSRVLSFVRKLFGRRLSRPIMLICETINICNNLCIICPYCHMKRKKQTMLMDLFEKVLADYSAIGGGKLSLTPVVGEVFLDKYLVERMRRIRCYPKITGVSFTTNASAVDKVADNELLEIIGGLERVHISVYGLDADEHKLITQRDTYEAMVKGIRRIVGAGADRLQISLGFRLVKQQPQEVIEKWIMRACGKPVNYGVTYKYANWGAGFEPSRPLPLDGQWLLPQENREQCLIPLSAVQVFSDGRVSFCPCPDYDASPELSLGRLQESSLLELINSEKNVALWNFSTQVPKYCRHCTFHRSLYDINQLELLLKDPVSYIGG